MPAKSNQFNTGNYNDWDYIVKHKLPDINNLIRKNVIPKIDEILKSMLGDNSDWIKEQIDVVQICNHNQLTGLQYVISYTVEDFQVKDAPRDAIQHDCEAIKQALASNEYQVSDIKINTQKGLMTITFDVPFEETNNDQARVPQIN